MAYYPTPRVEENACEALGLATSNPLVAVPLEDLISTLNVAMEEASCLTLKPKRNPHPRGVNWWNKECDATHTAGRLTTTFTEHCKATTDL